ncbi:MAG TPA: MBL fold metallo-hydrolase [Candidatus Polarisedimenticolaceae bacterium]|nr:MBL fold metallo-hydrolase [Candidatus Polarisedimenticolaceae bacterium]
MKIEASVWQKVSGTPSVDIFPIIPRANCVSSNCYIFSAPEALVVVDPGASAEQTRQISRILSDALMVLQRPVLIFLTHCHQDHSQEAGLELPAGTEVKRFAHQSGVEALKHRDRNLTTAYLYPWNPEICTARFEGILFASSPASEATPLEFSGGRRFELYTEPMPMPNGATLQRQWLSLGAGNRLEIYHTPGHSACSISLRIGSLLMLGDLPFAANPGVCGLDGWNHTDLLQTLHNVDCLLEIPDISECCPGHGYCVSAQSMREKLRLMEVEASNLIDVPLMGAERISGLKIYADELLEETAALLTIFSGRLYTVSYCLSMLDEEDGAATRVLESLDIDQIDRILSGFRRVAEAFNSSPMPEWTVVLKGVQVARSLQKVLSAENVRQILDLSLVDRAQRRLDDFLSLVRGLQFLQTEQPGAVNEIIAELLKRTKENTMMESADLMDAVDDDQSFLQALTRRLAAYSPLRDIEFEFAPAAQATKANIGAERLDDILINVMEGMAGMGVKHISIATQVASDQVEIRLCSRERMDPAAFGKRRLDLYNRTLGWLGGSLECIQHDGHADFVIRLPALESI